MSDPMSNIEIEDVLSSIRRLVSEDLAPARERHLRRELSPPRPDRLLLTPEQRVVVFRPAAEAPGLSERRNPQAGADDAAADGSLEDTIAELEAAVARIDGEFEPDEGDDLAALAGGTEEPSSAAGWQPEAWDDPFDDGLPPGPEAVPPAEPAGEMRLDAPITAGTVLPDIEAAVESHAADVVRAVFLRAGSDEGTQDLAEDPEEQEPPVAAEDGAHAANEDSEPLPEVQPDDETVPPEPWSGAAPAGRLHFGPAEEREFEPETENPETPAPPEEADTARFTHTPRILRAPIAEPVLTGSALAEDVAAGRVEPYDDRHDPDEMMVIDADALREIVVAILKQELQGPLGERITRNVRKLVRSEIHRVLETRDLE